MIKERPVIEATKIRPGVKIGCLTVIKPSSIHIVVKCDCGKILKVYRTSLQHWNVVSCGCLKNYNRSHIVLNSNNNKYPMIYDMDDMAYLLKNWNAVVYFAENAKPLNDYYSVIDKPDFLQPILIIKPDIIVPYRISKQLSNMKELILKKVGKYEPTPLRIIEYKQRGLFNFYDKYKKRQQQKNNKNNKQ
jgi:hypothetical protein